VEEQQTLEAVLNEIEGIIEQMQEKEVSLEDSFSLYEQGVGKLKLCNEKIDAVEKKMLVLGEGEE
jgi:exodeoxyribonuclease VII small subunit